MLSIYSTNGRTVRQNKSLTLSPLILLRLYTLPYWSNPPFVIFDIWALCPERQSARMSKITKGGLDQYGAEPFEQQQFETAGVEEAKTNEDTRKTAITWCSHTYNCLLQPVAVTISLQQSMQRVVGDSSKNDSKQYSVHNRCLHCIDNSRAELPASVE